MCARLWRELKVSRVSLEINTLGDQETRRRYREALVDYFTTARDRLDEDSLRRLQKNPLRILDSKNPDLQELVAGAPVMLDYLDDDSARHFDELKAMLDSAEVSYIVNPRLVRGLDYYNRTVFEWVTDALGSQGAVCSGGRYDGLVEQLGGRSIPAIGFAMGVERLVALFEICGNPAPLRRPDVYIVAVGSAAVMRGLELAETLRDALPALRFEMNLGDGSFKTQLKRADKSGAACAMILGEAELEDNCASLKPLRSAEDQVSVPFERLQTVLQHLTGQDTRSTPTADGTVFTDKRQ
jgi:histidyl-tRNA synthetase